MGRHPYNITPLYNTNLEKLKLCAKPKRNGLELMLEYPPPLPAFHVPHSDRKARALLTSSTPHHTSALYHHLHPPQTQAITTEP